MSVPLPPPTHRHSGQRGREQTCACVCETSVREVKVGWEGFDGLDGGFERVEVGMGDWWCRGVRLRGLEQGGAKGGKVAMFSGSCEQKSPVIVHSLLHLPRPSLPPVSLS